MLIGKLSFTAQKHLLCFHVTNNMEISNDIISSFQSNEGHRMEIDACVMKPNSKCDRCIESQGQQTKQKDMN